MVLDIAKKAGYEQAELEVIANNKPAIALYEKLGFQKYGTFPDNMKYADGSYADAYWMMKKPVSYTHLDVYKRQALRGCCWFCSGCCPISMTCSQPFRTYLHCRRETHGGSQNYHAWNDRNASWIAVKGNKARVCLLYTSRCV